MLSAPRDAADQRPGQNKNRGVQLVKLYVPFLFWLPTVPYQSPVCRAADAEQPCFLADKVFAVFLAEPISDILAATVTTITFLTRFDKILEVGVQVKKGD